MKRLLLFLLLVSCNFFLAAHTDSPDLTHSITNATVSAPARDTLFGNKLLALDDKDIPVTLETWSRNQTTYTTQGKKLSIKPRNNPITLIELDGITNPNKTTLLIDKPRIDGVEQAFAIDPTNLAFTQGTLHVTAKGERVYKCASWNYDLQQCENACTNETTPCAPQWEYVKDITPGKSYELAIDPYDPAFIEINVTSCTAQDFAANLGTWNSLCDHPYPGTALALDDNIVETHSFLRLTRFDTAGIRTNTSNSSITDCHTITNVELCHKWWSSTTNIENCNIAVDANGGASYSAASTTCPGTSEPASITCINVTSLELWTCDNFFGETGALATSELQHTGSGGFGIFSATWDVFFFNVSYQTIDEAITYITPHNTTVLINETVNVTTLIDAGIPVNETNYTLTSPDGTQEIISPDPLTSNSYTASFKPLLRGTYTINTTSQLADGTLITKAKHIRRKAKDLLDITNKTYDFATYSTNLLSNTSNILDIAVTLNNNPIKTLIINDYNSTSPHSLLRIEELPPNTTINSLQSYAIDPTSLDFANATATITAKGEVLFKCAGWNFTTQTCEPTCDIDEDNETTCDERWIPIMNITPGENYTLDISPDDPAFLETSLAVDVSMAPVSTTTFIIAYINATGTQLSWKLMNTTGSTLTGPIVVDTTVDIESRVFVRMINQTHFTLGYIDGPNNDLTHAIYNTSGTALFGPSDADINVGAFTDVSIAQLGDRYALCNANDADNDADYRIFSNNGASILGESNVDGNINPSAALQNLVSCAGINPTRWVYFWFDDQANIVEYEVLSETGAGIIGPVTLDSDVGETGQVATTGLNGNRFAIAYYDSTDDDITIAIISSTGTTILAPTDIDTNAGVDSRVAIAAIRNAGIQTQDLFAVAWQDQASIDIKAAVYNNTGGQITAPFTVTTTESTTFTLLDIVARASTTNRTLCPGTFAVAFSNTSTAGEFRTFYINGTTWDGTCNSLTPRVTNIQPFADTAFSHTENVTISASAIDDVAVTNVVAIISANNTNQTLPLTFNPATNRYRGVFTNTTFVGNYNVTIAATDEEGQINNTQTTNFFVAVPNVTFTQTGTTQAFRGDTLTYTIAAQAIDQPGQPVIKFAGQNFITNNTINSFSPQMVVTANGSIVITYHEATGAGNDDIFVVRSTDLGATFSTPISVAANASINENWPNIAVFNNTIYIVYEQNDGGQIDLFIRNSTNDGITWSTPLRITNTTYTEDEPSIEQRDDLYLIVFDAVIAPDTDAELYVITSNDLVAWSAPKALTNNSVNDYDPDVLEVGNTTYIVWAPENPDFQEIWFANLSNIIAAPAGILDSVAIQITDNDFYDFEPSVQRGTNNVTIITWVGLLNTAEVGNPDPTRTSNEIFLAQSIDEFRTTSLIDQITNDTTSDTYPAAIQQGATGFFFLAWMRANGGDMDLVFSSRVCSGGDARNVNLTAPINSNLTFINNSNTGNSTYSSGTNTVSLFESLLFEGANVSFSFNATVNTNITPGNLTSIANIVGTDCDNNFPNNDTKTIIAVVLNEAPNVSRDFTLHNTTYLLNQTALVSANVSDRFDPIDVVRANITLPNGTITTIQLTNTTNISYFVNVSNLTLRGRYNVTFIANDTFNGINNTETTFFTRRSLNVFDITNIEEAINSTSITFLNYTVAVIANNSGILNLTVNITNKRITQLNVTIHNENSPYSILRIDDEFPYNPNASFAEYAIDPLGLNFTNATLSINATGELLWKCTDYNYTERDCNGDWILLQNITKGQLYTITINQSDPAFLETSAVADVALAPFANERFVIAFVDLADNDVSFRIMRTNGSIIVNTTDVDTTADTTSRVDVSMINTTHFVILWADGPSNTLVAARVNVDGTIDLGPATLDPNIGTNTDVSVAQITDSSVAFCYANDDDNDADFQIYNTTTGALITGETAVDTNMNPSLPLQNLISCTGVNPTRWSYNWFDDFAAGPNNRISYSILDETGSTIVAQTNIATTVGETAQTATAALDNNSTVILWYDSDQADITYAITNLAGTTIAGPTDLDTNAGTESRVAVTAIRENRTTTNDLFAAAWWDSSDGTIKASVVRSTGVTFTAPFNVSTAPNVSFPLIDIAARIPLTNTSICPGTFVVAFSNQSGQGEFKGFYANGTPWNGICTTIDSVGFAPGQNFLLNQSVNLSASTFSMDPTYTVNATIRIPNGTIITANLTNTSTDIWQDTFRGLNLTSRGRYNVTFSVLDTDNKIIASTTTFFNRAALNIIDVLTLEGNSTEPLINISFMNYTVAIQSNVSGILNLSVNLLGKTVSQINITNHNSNSVESILLVYDPLNSTTPTLQNISFYEYSIDPSIISLTNLTFTRNATGNDLLYKCNNFNFSGQECLGDWIAYRNITKGQSYAITINATDPGFLETSGASDVSVAPFDEELFVIAFVDTIDNDVSFRVMQTNGSIIVNTTDVDTTADTTSRVDVSMVNTTHFVIAWIDGPSNALVAALVNISGTTILGPATIDPAVGTNSDVSVAQITESSVAICYANDDDNDADFQIYNTTTGAVITGETSVDGNINPSLPLQNLISCTGVNPTRWSYNWFDDFAAGPNNRISYSILDETGSTIVAQTNIATTVGETAQTATAALDNNSTVILWYDSDQADITYAITNLAGTTIAGPTDLDTNAGTESRVAVTAVRENETATIDMFAATWWDSSDGTIKASVVQSDGTTFTSPFNVTTNANSTFPLIDIGARVTLTNTSLCPGTFVVAFTNSSGFGEFKAYYVNGTPWDGICGRPDLLPINITFNNTYPGENETINISSFILNNGTADATTSFIVQFFDGLCANGTQINGNITIPSLAQGANTTVSVNYTAFPVGPHNISVCVDVDNTIIESNETNNNLTAILNVSAYQHFYGQLTGNITLDTNLNETEYDWTHNDSGNIYFADSDQRINFTNLYALGRTTLGGIAHNDFLDADIVLNMTNFNDSIQIIWAINASDPRNVTNFTSFTRTIQNVPIVNSTNNSFVTGILWDASNSTNNEFDPTEREPLVFVTKIIPDNPGGRFGTTDYESYIPVLLRAINTTTQTLAVYVELR